MLNGGGGLNADGLSLDLQFAADKTMTARKGPTPVFTRGSTGTFVGSNGLIQSAATNIPRFDHTSAGVCRGLLIEESRTNLFTQSETWASGANFTGPSAPTVTPNTTNAPDGALTADTLTGSIGTATDGSVTSTWRQPTVSSSTAYTFSIYVRSLGVATKAEIRIRDNSSGASVQTLDTTLTSSWKRLSVTATTGGSTTSIRCIIQNTDGPIAIWGAQLEAGSFPTSYIPTTTGTLARSADVCSITGANFSGMWNQSEGTLLTQTQKTSTNSNAFVISASDNSFNNETDLRYNSVSQVAALINVSGASQLTGFQANITSGAAVKQSIAYKLNDCAYAANGASPIVDTSALIPTVDRLTIGNVAVAGQAFYLNGTIAAIRYYRKRLSNAKLQALTV